MATPRGTTQAADPGTNTSKLINYLRTTNPINPEVLAAYQKRLPTNRSNPYPEPGRLHQLARGLPMFGSYLCANPGPATFLGPRRRNPLLTDNLRRLIQKFVYTPTARLALLPRAGTAGPPGRPVGPVPAAAADPGSLSCGS